MRLEWKRGLIRIRGLKSQKLKFSPVNKRICVILDCDCECTLLPKTVTVSAHFFRRGCAVSVPIVNNESKTGSC